MEQEKSKKFWCKAYSDNKMTLGQITNSPSESYNSLFKKINKHPDRILQVIETCIELTNNDHPGLVAKF